MRISSLRFLSCFEKATYTYHKNDKLEWKQNLKGDIPHGTWISNYQNGQLEVEVNVENGKRHGHFERYYRNDQLETQGNFKYDVEDGPWLRIMRMVNY